MTDEQAERLYAWLVSNRVKNRRYRLAVFEELHLDPEIERPTSPEAQRLVAKLLKELRAK